MFSCLCVHCWRPKEEFVIEIKRVDLKPNADTPLGTYKAKEEVIVSGESKGSLFDICKNGSVDKAVDYGSNTRLWLGSISTDDFPEDTVVQPHSNIVRSNNGRKEISEAKSETPVTPVLRKAKNIDHLETVTSPKLKPITSLISPVDIKRQVAFQRKPSQRKVLSDWAELFDLETLDIKSDGFPSQTEVGFSGTISGLFTTRDSYLSAAISSKSILLLPGKVMGMFILKGNWLFQILNLNSSLNEVVNQFMFKESGVRLPLSYSRAGDNPPKNLSIDRMESTLSSNLGKDFDAQSQGLVFATGPVNSKLCYKMSVCALRDIKKIISLLCPENLPYK